MSTTEPEELEDPNLIEETKQQIRALVNEIAQLSQSDISELEFYEGVLSRIVSALAAHGGVIWKVDESGRLSIDYQINLQETGLAESEEKQIAHGKLLRRVIQSGEDMIIPPHAGAGDEDGGANPTDFLLLLGVLRSDQEVCGIIEIFQRSGATASVQRGYQRFLGQMCDLAGDFLKTRSLREFTDRQQMWNQLESFTRSVHFSLDPRQTAFAIANEGRRLIECDRVSVGVWKGSKCKIESVSGQDTFDKRSNAIVLLQKLANAVIRQGEPVWYTGDTSDMPPQVEDAVQAYVDDSHSKTVAIIPLFKPRVEDEGEENHDAEVTVGALIVEQIEDAKVREGTRQRINVVADHSAAALGNSVEHNNLFLMPLWRSIGKATWIVKARTLPKTITITSAIVAVILALCFVPADYMLSGDGKLQPVNRKPVYAPTSGTIVDVQVKHNQPVKKGDILAIMENTDLTVRITDITGELNSARERWTDLQDQIDRERNPARSATLYSEQRQLDKKIDSLRSQQKILVKEEEKLIIRSPINGVVLSWDVENYLKSRPVEVGTELMTIAEPNKDWEIVVAMPEDRMGDISRAMEELGRDEKMVVKYVLALDPKKTHLGYVDKIQDGVNPGGEKGSTVEILVAIDYENLKKDSGLSELRPGSNVDARLYCGRKAIGYVWFHDAINFLNRKVWFPVFG